MADLLAFPGRRGVGRTQAAYQLRLFDADDRTGRAVTILAHGDAEARRRAHRLTAGSRAELWSGERLVDHFPPAGYPIAGMIRPLGDPAG